MSINNMRNSFILRVNEKDCQGPDIQRELNDELYDSKLSSIPSSATSLGRYFYLEDENWKIDTLPTSTLDLQMRSSQNFENLKHELSQTKSIHNQTLSMANLKMMRFEQNQSTQQKPKKFYIPLTDEQKEQFRQKRLIKKNQEQKEIYKQFQEEKKRLMQKKSQVSLKKEENSQFCENNNNQQNSQQQMPEKVKKMYKDPSLPNLSLTESEILAYKQKIQELKQQKNQEINNNNENQNTQKKQDKNDSQNLEVQQEKQIIFTRLNEFQIAFDELQQNSENNKNIKDLVVQIKQLTKTDLEALFLAYLYISQQIKYTNKELKEGKLSLDLNGDKILAEGQGTPIAKANLFNQIAKQIGNYQCEIAKGIVKAPNYINGTKYKGNEQDSAWSIISYQNRCYSIDVNLGGGYLQGSKFILHPEIFYFLTEPLQNLYTHFPVNQKDFQMIPKNRHWSLEKFTNMPKFMPSYFSNKILFFSYNTQNCINTNNESLIFEIKSLNKQLAFQGILTLKASKPVKIPENECNDLIIEDQEKQEVKLQVKFQNYGQYTLTIQCAEVQQNQNKQQMQNNQGQEMENQNLNLNQNQNQNQMENQECDDQREIQKEQINFYDFYELVEDSQWEDLVTYDINYSKSK